VTVAPTVGNGIISAQGTAAVPKLWNAIDYRRFWGVGLQEGAVSPAAYKVHERTAGVNFQVEVDAHLPLTIGGGALVQGDTLNNQGLYMVAPHSTTAITLDPPAADASNPRVDIVVVHGKDTSHDGSGVIDGVVEYLAGTATSGATLANRSGAQNPPLGSLHLADVLIPTNATTVPNGNIRDRRKMASGAYYRGYSETSLTGSFGGVKQVPSGCSVSMEFSGAPVRIVLRHGKVSAGASAPMYGIRIMPIFDEVTPPPPGGGGAGAHAAYPGLFASVLVDAEQPPSSHTLMWTPSAGFHKVEFAFVLDNPAIPTQFISAPFEFVVEELVNRGNHL
jgi:hypothetical protein